MGKHKQGILGGFSGKVGPVVGSSWKGINVLKAKPVSVANPRTAPQIEQRGRMSAIVILVQFLLSTHIKPLWDRFAQQMSGYNAFVSANIACFVNGVFTLYSDFKLSIGKIASEPITLIVAVPGAPGITPNWVNNGGQGFKQSSDIGYCVVYRENTDEWFYSTDNLTRASEGALVTVTGGVGATDIFHCYLSFRRADGTMVDTSSYLIKDLS